MEEIDIATDITVRWVQRPNETNSDTAGRDSNETKYNYEHRDQMFEVEHQPSDFSAELSASYDKTVKLWDVSTGALRSTLKVHADRVTSVAFSPNGQTVVAGSRDETVKLWNLLTAQILDTITAGGYINRVSFSEDGLLLQTDRGAFSSYALSEVTLNSITSLAEIAVGASWISWKGRSLLWLPPEYRGDIVEVYNSSVVLAQYIGRITFISFNTSFLLQPLLNGLSQLHQKR